MAAQLQKAEDKLNDMLQNKDYSYGGSSSRPGTGKSNLKGEDGRRGSMLRKSRNGNSFKLNSSNASFGSRRSISKDAGAIGGLGIGSVEDKKTIKSLKNKVREMLKEKEKLEKIQIDLTNKLMEIQKASK